MKKKILIFALFFSLPLSILSFSQKKGSPDNYKNSSQISSLLVADKGHEKIEQIDLEEAEYKGTKFTFSVVFSRMHPALVHLPIGWIVLLVLLDLGTFILKRQEFNTWGYYLLILILIGFIPAISTGLVLLAKHGQNPQFLSLAHLHRNIMLGVFSLSAVAFGLRYWQKNNLQGHFKWIYLAIILIMAGLLSIGGHIGGKMVFGIKYLPF